LGNLNSTTLHISGRVYRKRQAGIADLALCEDENTIAET